MVIRVVLFFVFMFECLTVEACIIKLRVAPFEPYMIKHEAGWNGVDIEQAQALVNRLNCQLQFIEAPWARGVSMLKVGKIDMMVNVSKTSLRQKFFYFAGPQRIESIRIVSEAQTIQLVTNWHQLSRLDAILMRQRGTFFGKRFERLLRQNDQLRRQMHETVGHDIRLDLIEKGRVDAFVVDMAYFSYLQKTNPNAQNLIIHPLAINDSPVYFAFSKASISNQQMAQINLAVATLITEGTFNSIMTNYR